MTKDRFAVLYTSLTRDGAIAEITFHWSQLSPPPNRPAMIHELVVATRKTATIRRQDFARLGISEAHFGDRKYQRTQEVGEAAAFLGFDGIFVPSARSQAQHLVLFPDNREPELLLDVISSSEVALSLPRENT